jgi:hypothetical protein
MMTSSSVYVLFIDDGGYLAPVAKAPYDGGQRNQAIYYPEYIPYLTLTQQTESLAS